MSLKPCKAGLRSDDFLHNKKDNYTTVAHVDQSCQNSNQQTPVHSSMWNLECRIECWLHVGETKTLSLHPQHSPRGQATRAVLDKCCYYSETGGVICFIFEMVESDSNVFKNILVVYIDPGINPLHGRHPPTPYLHYEKEILYLSRTKKKTITINTFRDLKINLEATLKFWNQSEIGWDLGINLRDISRSRSLLIF